MQFVLRILNSASCKTSTLSSLEYLSQISYFRKGSGTNFTLLCDLSIIDSTIGLRELDCEADFKACSKKMLEKSAVDEVWIILDVSDSVMLYEV